MDFAEFAMPMRSNTTDTAVTLDHEQVAVARRARRMSQAELGFSIRRSQPFISDYERGIVTLTPREEKIVRLILGIGGAK